MGGLKKGKGSGARTKAKRRRAISRCEHSREEREKSCFEANGEIEPRRGGQGKERWAWQQKKTAKREFC